MPRKKDYERKGGELEEIEGLSGRLTADLQKRVHLIKSCAVRAAERKFRWSWFCVFLEEDGGSSPTPQKNYRRRSTLRGSVGAGPVGGLVRHGGPRGPHRARAPARERSSDEAAAVSAGVRGVVL